MLDAVVCSHFLRVTLEKFAWYCVYFEEVNLSVIFLSGLFEAYKIISADVGVDVDVWARKLDAWQGEVEENLFGNWLAVEADSAGEKMAFVKDGDVGSVVDEVNEIDISIVVTTDVALADVSLYGD